MRFRSRAVQQTVVDLVTTELAARGWVDDPVNFGTTAARVIEDVSVDEAPEALEPNTVAVTIEDEGPDEVQQLGGGLQAVEYSLFVDCYGETGPMAQRILQDMKDALRDRVVRVMDYVGETPVETTEVCEFEVLAIERPGRSTSTARSMEARRRWRVMTVTVTVTFPEPEPVPGPGWGGEPVVWGEG